MNVLIIEDTVINRVVCEQHVRDLGHDVAAYAHAETALEAYHAKFYPLILLDLILPGMDGIEFCRRIRALPGGDRSIILVITAQDMPERIQEAIDAGADDYLIKPIGKNMLTRRLLVMERQYQHLVQRKQAEADLRVSQEQLRNLSLHMEAVREEERTTVARTIHDELGQTLTALKFDIVWLKKRLTDDQSALREKAGGMENLIDTTLHTVKEIASQLRPGLLDELGLSAAIEWQADEFQRRTEIQCAVRCEPDEIILSETISTAIFRIFQETLTNVARHAGATQITVVLIAAPSERLVLKVSDNGCGITPEQIASSSAFGLIGIRERVQSLEGEVTFQGIPDQGTTVTVEIPCAGND